MFENFPQDNILKTSELVGIFVVPWWSSKQGFRQNICSIEIKVGPER